MPRRGASETKSKAKPSPQIPKTNDASKKQVRETTLYDAIAGRVSSEGFLSNRPVSSRYRDTGSHSTQPVSPEKGLFRRTGRDFYGENDPYWADIHLEAKQKLPDSDISKAVHSYVSDFYGRTLGKGAEADYGSMDESALLGFGILLEEMADEVLGKTGDLAFTEGEAVGLGPKRRGSELSDTGIVVSGQEGSAALESAVVTTETESASPEPRRSKRRKKRHPESDG